MNELVSGLIGAFLGLFVMWLFSSHKFALDLLSEALNIQALLEAWILEGPNLDGEKISNHMEPLPTVEYEDLWLRKVEVRFVLDEGKWNSPQLEKHYYGRIGGRRAWIIRDQVIEDKNNRSVDYHPALLSSRAMEELCGWIERVASMREFWPFPRILRHRYEMLRPLAGAVCGNDRIEVFSIKNRLSTKAVKYLEWYQSTFNTSVKHFGLHPLDWAKSAKDPAWRDRLK